MEPYIVTVVVNSDISESLVDSFEKKVILARDEYDAVNKVKLELFSSENHTTLLDKVKQEKANLLFYVLEFNTVLS